jgi:hypothetical protein
MQAMLRLFENNEMRRVIIEKGAIERDAKTGAEQVNPKTVAMLGKLLDMDHKITGRDPKKQLFFSDGARIDMTAAKRGIISATGKEKAQFYHNVRHEPGSSMGLF